MDTTIWLFLLLCFLKTVNCGRPLLYSTSSSSSSTSYSAANVCNCPPQPVCPQYISPQPSCGSYVHAPSPPFSSPLPALIPLPWQDLSKVMAIPTVISRREASDEEWGNGLEAVTASGSKILTTTQKLKQTDVNYPEYGVEEEESSTKAPKTRKAKAAKVERHGCAGPSCIDLLRRLFSPITQKLEPPKQVKKRSTDDQLVDPKCNSERLRLVIQSATGKDLATIKKNIQLLAEQRLQGRFNVICADDDFSYITNTEEFCQEIVSDKTCYVFKQINRASTGSRRKRRRKFLVHRLLFN